MPRSMTGFAQREGFFGDFRIAWRIKSLNHRFLDLAVRLPEGCGGLEQALNRRLKERFSRGHLECVLSVQAGSTPGRSLELDEGVLVGLLALERQVMMRFGGESREERLGMDRLLSWPGVVRERRLDVELVEGAGREAVFGLLDATMAELDRVREVEGRELAGVMRRLLEQLRMRLDEVARELPRIRETLAGRLRERVLEYTGALAQDERLAQELAFLLNRQDIVEETDRMTMHVREMVATLEDDGGAGKRLDFLCQELHREANTLCSKAQDGLLSRLGVDIKVLVEQLREQAQNLE
ncbi:MAG: YicC family protein [Magnetococcales bacterium]|nr:YicC family protein [Magnetococcales bacterium]